MILKNTLRMKYKNLERKSQRIWISEQAIYARMITDSIKASVKELLSHLDWWIFSIKQE